LFSYSYSALIKSTLLPRFILNVTFLKGLKMIYVIAIIDLNPGTRANFIAEMNKIVPLVLAEQGCIEYGPAIDLASGIFDQQPLRENTLLVVEKWASLNALNDHRNAMHMINFRPKVKDFVKSIQLQILTPC